MSLFLCIFLELRFVRHFPCNLFDVFVSFKAVRLLSQKLEFYRHPELGFLTNCPSNLGTAIRAGVHIKLPNLERAGKINELCERYKLQPRGKLRL